MNKEIWLLFKNYLINQYHLNVFGKNKTRTKIKPSSIIVMISMAVLALLFAGYSFAMAYGLCMIGLAALIPVYAVTFTSIASLIFTIIKTNGFLFGYRDYELLMALPVSTRSVVASRFLAIYVPNMLIILIFMIPMGIGYAFQMQPGILFYVFWLIGTLTAPLLPTVIAVMAGAFIMAVASRFKYTRLLTTILSLLLVAGSVLLSMSVNTIGQDVNLTDNLAELSRSAHEAISRFYPPAGWFAEAINKNSLLPFILYCGISLLSYLLLLLLLSSNYKTVNTAIKGHIKKAGYQLTALHAASPLQALYRKELKRFLTCTPYVTNAGVGAIMALLFAAVFMFTEPGQLEKTIGISLHTTILYQSLPFILATLLAMSCTSSASLSLEGKQLWILQSSPVTTKIVFDSKILVNLTLTLPVSLICSLLVALCLRPDPGSTLLLFAVPVTSSLFSAIWGMFMNILMPRYDWTSEMSAVKQGPAFIAGMMGGPLIILAGLGLTFLPLGIDYRWLSALVTVLTGTAGFLLYRHISHIHTLTRR